MRPCTFPLTALSKAPQRAACCERRRGLYKAVAEICVWEEFHSTDTYARKSEVRLRLPGGLALPPCSRTWRHPIRSSHIRSEQTISRCSAGQRGRVADASPSPVPAPRPPRSPCNKRHDVCSALASSVYTNRARRARSARRACAAHPAVLHRPNLFVAHFVSLCSRPSIRRPPQKKN